MKRRTLNYSRESNKFLEDVAGRQRRYLQRDNLSTQEKTNAREILAAVEKELHDRQNWLVDIFGLDVG